jgi:hypothetical protein
VHYDAPDQEFILFRHPDWIEIVVGGHQPATVAVNFDPFDGKLTIYETYGNFSIRGFQAFIDDDQVAIIDTCIQH